MITEEQKIKNIKDLQYSNNLNKQNIILILIGTSLISILLTDQEKIPITKVYLILLLIIMGIIFILYFNKKLNKIIENIEKL